MDSIETYLDLARAGAWEEAFHGLKDLDPDTLPALRQAFRDEREAGIRGLIVKTAWCHRRDWLAPGVDPATISVLAEALADPAPEVWQQALDGLVALACPEAVATLQAAHDREPDPERRAWMAEAAEQATEAVARGRPS